MVNRSKVVWWCKFMEISLLVGLVSTPVLGLLDTWLQAGNNIMVMGGEIGSEFSLHSRQYSSTGILAISSLLRDGIISFMLWNFYAVFKNIRHGEIFSQQQVKRISISGKCFIILSVYLFAKDMLMPLLQETGEELQFYFNAEDIIYIPIGVGLVILSHVLRLATGVKEEQELVI